MPVSFKKVEKEFYSLSDIAGLPRYQVMHFRPLDEEHNRDRRRYAQVRAGNKPRMEIASAFRELAPEHRLGLYAHELGHLMWPGGSESDADLAAYGLLDVYIGYDRAWPGKGLQTALLAPPKLWRIVGEPTGPNIRAGNGFSKRKNT